MTAVNDKQRIPADDVKATGPADIANTLVDILLADLPTLFNQGVSDGQYHGSVVELMVAQQGQLNVFAAAAVKVLTEQITGIQFQRIEICLLQGNMLLLANLLKDGFHRRQATVNDSTAALFEDAGLCLRNLFNGIAQNIRMVKSDIGNDRNLRSRDYIGGIKFAPQTNLQHNHITLLALEVFEGNGTDQLEFRGGFFHGICQGLDIFRDGHNILVADLLSVNLHPLVETVNVRGGIQSGSVSGFAQNGGGHGSGRTLAVGAGDVNIFQIVLGIAHFFQQCPNAVQTVNTAFPKYGMDVFDCFIDVHK